MQRRFSSGWPTDNAVPRQRKAHCKVKTGCKACKTRRQKCDEQKPKCSGCRRHSTHCLYVPSERAIKAKWRYVNVFPAVASSSYTQLQVPTPASFPPLPPARELNLEDLELLHQYITSTCIPTSQHPERTAQIQNTIPQVAQTHKFVMHGILGNAAVHLSWLRPDRKAHYISMAGQHHSMALPEFQSAMENINKENYLALIWYSKGLVWCSFAWFDAFSRQVPTTCGGTAMNWLPNWFYLLRGSCLIVEASSPWIQSGMHAMPRLDDVTEFLKSLDNRRILALTLQLLNVVEQPSCRTVLSDLAESFARASMRHHNTPLRNAINYWVGKISNEYIDAVHRSEPWALVIMAHFSILIVRSETRWFMKGHAKGLLHLIVERLPDTWEQYIQWPREEVEV